MHILHIRCCFCYGCCGCCCCCRCCCCCWVVVVAVVVVVLNTFLPFLVCWESPTIISAGEWMYCLGALFPQPILYHPRPLRTVLGPCKQIQFWMGESSFPLFNWWFFSFFYLSIFIFFWIIQIAFCFRWNHFSWLIPVCRVLPVNSSRLVDIFLRKDHRFGCFISPCLGPHLCSPLPRTTGAAVAMATTATPSTFVSTATRAATRPRPRRPAWRRRWPCWPGGGGKPQPAGPQTWKVGWGVGRFNGINGG